MAKNIASKRNIKIIAATSMAIFTLFASFSAAYAWFTAINTAQNSSTGFGVSYDDSTITADSVYCIKYDGIYGAVATELTNENHSLTMSEYDYIFTDRNVNTPLFLRIVINGYERSKDLNVVIPSSGDYKTGNNAYVNNWLSNVVCAKFSYGLKNGAGNIVADTYNLTGSTINGGNAQTIYEGMRDRAVDLAGTPFVTNVDTGAKNKTISISIPKNTITNDYIVGGKVVVYLEFDYYVTNSVNLVTNYIRSYDNVPEEPNRTFTSDIGTVSLRDSN